VCYGKEFSRLQAKVITMTLHTDYAFIARDSTGGSCVFSPGESRMMDCAAFGYDRGVAVMNMRGDSLLTALERMNEDTLGDGMVGEIFPTVKPRKIDSCHYYRIAVAGWEIKRFVFSARMHPESIDYSGLTMMTLWRRFMEMEY
jgi:hypothetical protein